MFSLSVEGPEGVLTPIKFGEPHMLAAAVDGLPCRQTVIISFHPRKNIAYDCNIMFNVEHGVGQEVVCTGKGTYKEDDPEDDDNDHDRPDPRVAMEMSKIPKMLTVPLFSRGLPQTEEVCYVEGGNVVYNGRKHKVRWVGDPSSADAGEPLRFISVQSKVDGVVELSDGSRFHNEQRPHAGVFPKSLEAEDNEETVSIDATLQPPRVVFRGVTYDVEWLGEPSDAYEPLFVKVCNPTVGSIVILEDDSAFRNPEMAFSDNDDAHVAGGSSVGADDC